MASPAAPTTDSLAILNDWLRRMSDAADVGDLDAFVRLFLPTGWMRGQCYCLPVTKLYLQALRPPYSCLTLIDLLCFSWELRSLAGRDKLVQYLSEKIAGDEDTTRFSRAGLHDIHAQTTSTLGPPSEFAIPGGTAKGVQGAFEFTLSSPPRLGRGFVRLVPDPNSEWKAFSVFMNLEDIKDREEPKNRPLGLYPGHATWEEVHAAKMAAIEKDPTVLIGAYS